LKATDNTKEKHTAGETGYNLETDYLQIRDLRNITVGLVGTGRTILTDLPAIKQTFHNGLQRSLMFRIPFWTTEELDDTSNHLVSILPRTHLICVTEAQGSNLAQDTNNP